jgi:hypothetical protein
MTELTLQGRDAAGSALAFLRALLKDAFAATPLGLMLAAARAGR